jgi:hypothetical protein
MEGLMEEILQRLKSEMFNGEFTFPPLQEYLLTRGEVRASFKYYNGPNQWQKRFYQEEHVILTDRAIVIACLYANGKMTIRTILLDEISRIERDYDFAGKNSKELILANVTILLKRTLKKKDPDELVFKRPDPAEQGDPVNYEKLIALLD